MNEIQNALEILAISETNIPSHYKTGIFYDARCLLHQANFNHSEGPIRVLRSFEKLVNDGIWNKCSHLLIKDQLFDNLSSFVHEYRKNSHVTKNANDFCDTSDSEDKLKRDENTEINKKDLGKLCENEQPRKYPIFTDFLVPKLKQPLMINAMYPETPSLSDFLRGIMDFSAEADEIRQNDILRNDSSSQSPLSSAYRQFYRIPGHSSARLSNPSALLVHNLSYVEDLESQMGEHFGADELDSETEGDDTLYPDAHFIDVDSYLNEFSWLSAATACAGVIGLSKAIIEGTINNAFALIRPPGHHAGLNSSGGFCLFNNIALAAETALRHPLGSVSRVLIVDFDVHHGDGTQDIFYERNDVLFFSIHRFEDAFFPNSGAVEQIGEGKGKGFTVNAPISTHTSDEEFLAIFRDIFLPIAIEFRPDMLLISAGFDVLQGDPLGLMNISPDCIEAVINCLLALMRGKNVLAALEGGYNPDVVADGVARLVRCFQNSDALDCTNPSSYLCIPVEGQEREEEKEEKVPGKSNLVDENKKLRRKEKLKCGSAKELNKITVAQRQKDILFKTELKKIATVHMNYWRSMYQLVTAKPQISMKK